MGAGGGERLSQLTITNYELTILIKKNYVINYVILFLPCPHPDPLPLLRSGRGSCDKTDRLKSTHVSFFTKNVYFIKQRGVVNKIKVLKYLPSPIPSRLGRDGRGVGGEGKFA